MHSTKLPQYPIDSALPRRGRLHDSISHLTGLR
jgi:hypothetical protein